MGASCAQIFTGVSSSTFAQTILYSRFLGLELSRTLRILGMKMKPFGIRSGFPWFSVILDRHERLLTKQ